MPKITKTPKSASTRKAEVMQWLGITSEEYSKQLNVFGNRVRSLQKIAGRADIPSPAYLFHDYAYRMKFKGGQLSGTLAGVLSAPASSTRARTSEKAQRSVQEKYLLRPFRGLIAKSPTYTAGILNNSSLTIEEKVQALRAYGERIREKERMQRARTDDMVAGGVIVEDVEDLFSSIYED